MKRRRLIVNCDDLGANAPRDRGILEALAAGAATSASLLANGESFEEAAAAVARDGRLRATVGLHLNLSEGAPLAPGHRTLVGPDGRFSGKEETRRRLRAGLVDPEEVAREIAAQLERLARAGLHPVHLDGHQHVHVLGPVPRALARAAHAADVPFVRVPADPALPELAEEAARAAEVFRAAGLRAPDHFRGAANMWAPSEPGLHEVLRALPEGTTELMVHPGYAAGGGAGPSARFSTADREVELRALLSQATRELLERERIELVSFSEL